MAWNSKDIPDQHGRVAVVTGANSGLGLEVSWQLARKGARVVMAARDQQRAQDARDGIAADVENANVEVRHLDLASLESVRACAEAIVADHGRVDLLVNNAGLMGVPEQSTADGFELQLGVNHLGHFALTRRLLPALAAAPSARVISVTSFARLMSPALRSANPHLRGTYNAWWAYGQSKLANLHFAMELHRRLEQAGASIQSIAAHPGLAKTGLQARSVRDTGGGLGSRFWHATAKWTGMSSARGALPLLRAATDPKAHGGQMLGPVAVTVGPAMRRPVIRSGARRAGQVLWEVSERETDERFDVAEIVAATT